MPPHSLALPSAIQPRGPGAPAARRPLTADLGAALGSVRNRIIAGSSLVPNDPVLDVRLFPWTQDLREHWRAIRDEALRGAADARLWGAGDPTEVTAARCPATAALVARIPGIARAAIAALAPGAHLPERRGGTKALVTCQLGLVVPRDGDARMRVGDRIVRWAEGETLVFDDTYPHAAWNEARGARIVLELQVARPLRHPGRWLAALSVRDA